MKYIKLGKSDTSAIVMGCMRIAGMAVEDADALIHTALDCGITLFDHADIYGGGQSEMLFGEVLRRNPGLRDRMLIQSKCGICKDDPNSSFYDLSYQHIVKSVEGSLKRLGIETLDCLLFHRPDALTEQEDFARAVQELKAQGKVRQFGVSNMNPAQIQLLESWSGEHFVADQLQLSLMHAGMVTSGINVNVANQEGTMYDGSVLPYCQRTGITVQAWSPFQYGMLEGCFIGNDKFPQLNEKLNELAEKYEVTPSAIALAWILRIPGNIQVIVGTTSPVHMREACTADTVSLTRKEWYELYRSCGYRQP